jgi:hypothetical protein
MKTTKATRTAIEKRISAGYDRFYIGKYYYMVDTIADRIKRIEQKAGYTPTSDWEWVKYEGEWQ